MDLAKDNAWGLPEALFTADPDIQIAWVYNHSGYDRALQFATENSLPPAILSELEKFNAQPYTEARISPTVTASSWNFLLGARRKP